MRIKSLGFLPIALACSVSAVHASSWGSTDIKSGFGEELYIKHGLLGTKDTEMKDRLGDKYEDKEGLVNTDKAVNVLGNGFTEHKGLLSGKTIEAKSILGDKVETRKTFFGLGPRKTEVDFSGVSSLVQQFATQHLFRQALPYQGYPPSAMPQAISSNGTPDQSMDAAAGLTNDSAAANQSTPNPADMPQPMESVPRRW